MSDQPDAATAENDPNLLVLISSASRWIRQALIAWADDDFAAVAMLAPIAAEHLAKAALWRRNPVLLVPLSSNAEESLHVLASKPDLANAKLKTVGLAVAIQRAERFLDPFPLSNESRRNLVDVRNGSIHVGVSGTSRHLLHDTLSLCNALLLDLEVDAREFYGDQETNVRGLLDARRTEVELVVSAKTARARNHLAMLEEKLGTEVFQQTSAALEAEAPFAIDPGDFSSFGDTIAVGRDCPVCGSVGRLIGRLDVDPQVDWDVEPMGDGHYESYVAGSYWDLSLSPQKFVCNVCKLALDGPDELASTGLTSARYNLEPNDLDEDFDVDEFARSLYENYD